MRLGALLLLVLAVLGGCRYSDPSTVEIPHPREFRPERNAARRDPVILIPGTLGSRLYNTDNGEIAWGSLAATISELSDDLDLPIDRPRLSDNRDKLKAYRVLDNAEVLAREGSGEVRFYAELIDYLSSTLGYRPAFGRKFYRGQDLFVFFYDWRRSNVEAAVQLKEFVDTIRGDLNSPDMKFTFVAVSNGGIVARYYLRYGGSDQVSEQSLDASFNPTGAGAKACSRLICLSTPHSGTIDALQLIHEGYAPNLISRHYSPATIFSFPAAFELLPEPGEKVFVGDGGETLDIDLWDAQSWETYGLSVFNPGEQTSMRQRIAAEIRPGEDRAALYEEQLADQRRYLRIVLTHAARLKRAVAGPCEVPLHVIVGVTTPTLARVGAVSDGEEWEFYFRPRLSWGRSDPMTEAMYALGDGIVTRRSGLGLALPGASHELQERGRVFRDSLESWTLASLTHREMFSDPLLRLTLAEMLSHP